MFSRYYTARAETANQNKPVPTAPYVVRDNRTKNEIARGSYEQCVRFMNGFGECYVEPAQ